ncbi:EAL domain-containing protein [Phenylobacterium sp. J426]|nr:EAL domain-containing protein [Phenylobacterium sp. J426]
MDSATDGIMVIDHGGKLTYYNSVAQQQVAPNSLEEGQLLASLLPEGGRIGFFPWIERSLGAAVERRLKVHLPWSDRWIEVRACPAGSNVVLFSRDVTAEHARETESRRSLNRLTRAVRVDALTGLGNRAAFLERLSAELAAAEPRLLALFYVDLDGFKDVNDTLGHRSGDQLLQKVGRRLRKFCADGAACRFGGDEFGIFRPIEARADVEALSEALLAQFRRPFVVDGAQILLGASVGVTLASRQAVDAEELIRSADVALYRAKTEGRNTFRIFDQGMADSIARRWRLKVALKRALLRRLFYVAYQPIVDLQSGYVAGFEALLRCRDKQLSSAPLTELIELAEETGEIEQIGELVLRTSCAAAAAWPPEMFLSVNVSSVQFRSGQLRSVIEAALQASGLAAERLHIEITETVPLAANDSASAQLDSLRELGVRILLDDFGTGFASLTYLRAFPFDGLKLDRSFVSHFSAEPETHVIARAVGAIAHGLGLRAFSEGVETKEHARALKRKGYRFAQGFLFAEPLSETSANELAQARFRWDIDALEIGTVLQEANEVV